MNLTTAEQAEKHALENKLDSLMAKPWLSPAERADYDQTEKRLSDLNRQGEIPAQVPSQPQLSTPHQPTPSMPADPALSSPAPFSATPASNTSDHVAPDLSQPIETAPPVPGQTQFLPLTGNQSYDDTIKAMDKALQNVNDKAFKLNPQDLWEHDDAHLGGATGPTNISALTQSSDGFKNMTAKADESLGGIKGILSSHDGDTALQRLQQGYQPMIDAANEGFGDGGRGVKARASLDESGSGAQGVFSTFHGAITSSRDAIAGLYGIDKDGNRYLDTSRPLNLDTHVAETASAQLDKIRSSSQQLGKSLDGWSLIGDSSSSSPSNDTTLSGSTGSSGGDLGGSSGGGSPSSDNTMSAPASATPSSSPSSGGSPMGGMPQMPSDLSSLAGAGQQPPAAGDTQLSGDTDAPREGTSAVGAADDTKADSKVKAPTDTSSAAGQNMAMMQVPHAGDPVRPGALGADGKPLDKDGDGKMDADALAVTKENMDPDGDGVPNKFTIPIDNGERSVDVTMDDPRLAEMMTRLADADPDHPLSVLDAAKQSGLDLDSLGQDIDVMGIKEGDVVEGVGKGMYMGHGMVVMEDGQIKSLEDVMDYGKSDPKVHRLDLPEIPSEAAVVPDTPNAAPVTETSVSPEAPESSALSSASDRSMTEMSAPREEAPAAAPPHETPAAAPQPAQESHKPATAPQPAAPASSGGIKEVPFEGYAMGG